MARCRRCGAAHPGACKGTSTRGAWHPTLQSLQPQITQINTDFIAPSQIARRSRGLTQIEPDEDTKGRARRRCMAPTLFAANKVACLASSRGSTMGEPSREGVPGRQGQCVHRRCLASLFAAKRCLASARVDRRKNRARQRASEPDSPIAGGRECPTRNVR